MKNNILITTILGLLLSCNSNSNENISIIDEVVQDKNEDSSDIFIIEEISDSEDELSSGSLKTKPLYQNLIGDYIPKRATDSIFVDFEFDTKDSIHLIKFMKLNMKNILEDTNNIFLDSLSTIYPYDFPSDDFENYFSNLRIKISNRLTFNFSYKDELKNMSRHYKSDDPPTLEKVKNERYSRFDMRYDSDVIFGIKYDYFEKSVVLFLHNDLNPKD